MKKMDTILVQTGRHSEDNHGSVNVPVYRMTSVVAKSLAELNYKMRDENKYNTVLYGRWGTPTTFALEEAVAEIEGGYRSISMSGGAAAITATLSEFVSTGDHLLVTDNVYAAVRNFCEQVLPKFGVETTYYDPAIGGDIKGLIRDNTKLVWAESPGSMTFEMADIPAIAEAAHARNIPVAIDNTWGLMNFQPFTKGVDICIQAATKYIVGHADAILGFITVKDPSLYDRIRANVAVYGFALGSEEAFLGLRGIRTLGLRLRHQFEAGLRVAEWLEKRPEVARVMHPALPSNPGYAIWSRDYNGGGAGLFAVELGPFSDEAVVAMLDGYKVFTIGYSWGGFESLVVPSRGRIRRSATKWTAAGPTLRYHVGLEDLDDLIDDLAAGFDRLAAFEREHGAR
jgi:cystathionine beta-lyase